MEYFLATAYLFVSALNWKSVACGNKRLEYLTKPMAMVVLLALATTLGPVSCVLAAAIVLSLAGDVFLMLPGNYFTGGLVAFLLAHLCYIAAIDAPIDYRIGGTAIALAATLPVTVAVMKAVSSRFMQTAVVVYIAAIALMAGSAFASGSPWAAAGALLFLFSDSLLAFDYFVKPVSLARPLVMITYHLGQLGLVLALAP